MKIDELHALRSLLTLVAHQNPQSPESHDALRLMDAVDIDIVALKRRNQKNIERRKRRYTEDDVFREAEKARLKKYQSTD